MGAQWIQIRTASGELVILDVETQLGPEVRLIVNPRPGDAEIRADDPVRIGADVRVLWQGVILGAHEVAGRGRRVAISAQQTPGPIPGPLEAFPWSR